MKIKPFVLLFIVGLLMTNCAQVAPLHSARTEGDGNFTFTPTVDGTGANDRSSGSIGFNALPGLRAELAYGLSDRFDIIASVYSAGSIKTSIKYQIFGDNYSNFIIAAMPGYEYQGNFVLANGTSSAQVQRLHFPIIFNVNSGDLFDYYLGPNVILQFETGGQNTAFPGLHSGFEFGSRIKYNIGGAVYAPYAFNVGIAGILYQFGVSVRIPIFR